MRLTNDQALTRRIGNLWDNSEILKSSPPVAGAIELLNGLFDLEWEIRIATSRLPQNRDALIEWFKMHLPRFNEEKIHMRSGVSEISGDDFKLFVVGGLQANFFVEDNGETVSYLRVGLSGINPRTEIRLFSRSWNESFSDLDNIRVRRWEEMLDEIRTV